MSVRDLRPHLPSLAAVVAAWLVLTGPLLWHANTHVASHGGRISRDAVLHAWQFWWLDRAMAEGAPVFQTNMLTYPAQVNLHELWGGHLDLFLGLPLHYLLGPLAAANLVLALVFLTCGLGVYLLALEVSGHRPASAVGAILYMLSPVVMEEAAVGRVEQLSFGLVALSLWGFGRWLSQGRARHLAFGFSMLGVATVGYLGAAMTTALLLPVLAAGTLYHPGEGSPGRRLLLQRGGGAVLAVVVLSVPVFWYASAHLDTPWFVWSLGEGVRGQTYQSWLESSRAVSMSPRLLTLRPDPAAASLGLVLVLLAAASLFRPDPRRPVLPWVLGALVLVLLALGPDLSSARGAVLPLPYRLLPHFVPFSLRFHWPYRIALLAGVCVAVLASAGLTRLTTLPRLRAWPIQALVAALVLSIAAYQVLDLAPLPVLRAYPSPSAYEALDEPSQGAVFDVNLAERHTYDPFLAQMRHQRPICCLELPPSLQPAALTELQEQDPGYAWLSGPFRRHSARSSGLAVPQQLDPRSLADLGFTHVVVHYPRLDQLPRRAHRPGDRSVVEVRQLARDLEHRLGPAEDQCETPIEAIEVFSLEER